MKINFLLFFFTAIVFNQVNAQCDCGSAPNWSPSLIRIATGTPKNYKCNYQFAITCRDTVWLRTGVYNCTSTPCTQKYKANVYTSTGVNIRTLDPLPLVSTPFVFNRPGTYKLELIASCNNNSCVPCYYYFTVTNSGCSPK